MEQLLISKKLAKRIGLCNSWRVFIYGMKQASWIWNKTFHNTVIEWGFQCMWNELCVYHWTSATSTMIFTVHVDDIIVASSLSSETDCFKAELLSWWEISNLDPAKFALGITINHDLLNHTISTSQIVFIDRIIEQFHQTDAHPCDTPMVASLQLRRPDKSIPPSSDITQWMARTPYCKLVGSLNYLTVTTCPDIAYFISRLASFLNCYCKKHWYTTICLLRYIKGPCPLFLEETPLLT